MNKFFVPDEIYEERLAICKGCVYYKKLFGNCSVCKCFMKIKARISKSRMSAEILVKNNRSNKST